MNTRPKWLAGAVLLLVLLATVAAPAHSQFPFQPAPASPQPAPHPAPHPAPQPAPHPAPAPAGDQRVAQIKANLERGGLRVLGLDFKPAQGNNPPAWFITTAANYAQPSFSAMFTQAFSVWGAAFEVVTRESPETVLFTGQHWSKYLMIFVTQVKHLTTFATSMNAAGNDEGRKKTAFETFLQTLDFRVYDIERQQYVDQKDFVNKNFTR